MNNQKGTKMDRNENAEEISRNLYRPSRRAINTSNYKRDSLPDFEKEFHHSMKFNGNSSNTWNDSPMSKQRTVNITDSFMNSCRHEKTEITVTLSDNTEEEGIIVAFDHSSIIMNNNMNMQFLIMRNCILKIVPMQDVDYIFKENYNSIVKNDRDFIDYSGKTKQ